MSSGTRQGGAGVVAPLRHVTPEQVAAEITAAWPDAAEYPNLTNCGLIAGAVNEWVDRTNTKKIRKPSEESIRNTHNNYVTMHKHARAFLRAAMAVIDDLKSRRMIVPRPAGTENMPPDIWEAMFGQEDRRPDVTKALAAIEAAALALAAIPDRDPARWEDREPAEFIAEWVIRGWPATGAAVNLSPGGRPMAAFVARIMALAGFHRAEFTVSDRLRKRQNRPRNRKADPGKILSKSKKKQNGANRSGISRKTRK